MATPTAAELLTMIDEGRFDELPGAFVEGCLTWRRDLVEEYGDVLIRLRGQGSDEARSALLDILHSGNVYRWGPWRGIKLLFKQSETERPDPELYGLIASRLDHGVFARGITVVTRNYIRRRAWRHLRNLARQRPQEYAAFAAQLLRFYEQSRVGNPRLRCKLWAFNHIGWRGSERGHRPGNSAMYYTINNWRQRAKKQYWWQAEEWQLFEYDQYAYSDRQLWTGHFPQILGVLGTIRNVEGAKLLIHIARSECAGELSQVSFAGLRAMFSSDFESVVDFALELFQHVPSEDVPIEFMLDLLSSSMGRLVEFAKAWLDEHATLARLGLARAFELSRHHVEAVAAWAATLIRREADANDVAWEQIIAAFASQHLGVRTAFAEFASEHWKVWQPASKAVFDLTESLFPDVRKAAFRWLLEQYTFDQIDRADVLDLIDSDFNDVRDFAKQYLEKYFDQLHVLADLGRLSEHPEPSVQHWVVALVYARLRDDADQLVRLMPFFRHVLFGVNRGAAEKEKSLAMLIELAAGSRARAEAVVALCSEFIQSYGRAEWVKSLVGLARLRERYADLDVPLELVAPPKATARGA